jgi:hypothetical protein
VSKLSRVEPTIELANPNIRMGNNHACLHINSQVKERIKFKRIFLSYPDFKADDELYIRNIDKLNRKVIMSNLEYLEYIIVHELIHDEVLEVVDVRTTIALDNKKFLALTEVLLEPYLKAFENWK